ncbi:MAG: acylphosphatase [Planctomycetota bacterium]|jgi:acylphosphatase
MASAERRTILYSGRVQGVGFRWTVLRLLGDLSLTGYVRNLRSGGVELVLEGDPTEVEKAAGLVRAQLRANIDEEVQATGMATGEFPDLRVAP